jgi:hypothetical protein
MAETRPYEAVIVSNRKSRCYGEIEKLLSTNRPSGVLNGVYSKFYIFYVCFNI